MSVDVWTHARVATMATDEVALREAAQEAHAASMPVHIHVAEQVREVEDCLEHHGQRPIDRLLSGVTVNKCLLRVESSRPATQ